MAPAVNVNLPIILKFASGTIGTRISHAYIKRSSLQVMHFSPEGWNTQRKWKLFCFFLSLKIYSLTWFSYFSLNTLVFVIYLRNAYWHENLMLFQCHFDSFFSFSLLFALFATLFAALFSKIMFFLCHCTHKKTCPNCRLTNKSD